MDSMRTAIGLALAAGLGTTGLAALAQSPPPQSPGAAVPRVFTFDIPAQPLADALAQFGRQSGLQVSAHGDLLRGLSSPAISGTLTADGALGRLLGGSGILYSLSGNTVILQKPGAPGVQGALQLDPVQVQGAFPVPSQALIDNIPAPYAGGQVATGAQLGLLGNRSVMDAPFNQTSYTAQKGQNQQARTVRDVLIDDPSVRTVWPSGGSLDEAMWIRGFYVGSLDTSFNGLYGMLPVASVAAELPERVEILKGPSAMLTGMAPGGAIGGTVNVVPKRAGNEPLNQVTAGYAYSGQFGAHADVGRRVGDDQQFGARFNGVFRAGNTAIERNTEQVGLASLGLDFRGDNVRLSLDLGFQSQVIGGLVSYVQPAAGVAMPAAPSNGSNFGQTWTSTDKKDLFAVLRGEVDLTESITAYAALGAHDNKVSSFSGGNPVATNANGDITQTPFKQDVYNSFWSGEAGLRAKVPTGPIDHEFALSAMAFRQESGAGSAVGTTFTSNIYRPNLIAQQNLPNPGANKTGLTVLSGFAFADTLSVADKRLQITAGGRLQNVKTANYDPVSGAETSTYDASAFSPSVALVFKPWSNVSVYGNWIQGLQPGQLVPAGFANAGETFAPFKSTQFEVGVKIDWGKLTTTVSAFQIAQPSAITDTATNTLTLAGQQRNRGLEFNVFGEPVPGVRLLGGAMLLEAIITQSQGGTNDGWQAFGSPGLQINLGGEWDLPFAPGLTLNGRVIYTAAQYIDLDYPRRTIPDWTRIDVGARYVFENAKSPTGHPVALRFNVENLFDAQYWGTAYYGYAIQGSPRTFRLSATADF